MIDADNYLRLIGCGGRTGVDIATLRKLHKRHLMAIPYNGAVQNFSGPLRFVDPDESAMFETSIAGGQGGTCFELNRLFFRLLGQLGYDVTLMASSTAEGRETFGTDVEHMFFRVSLDGGEWLVDVGYPGPSYLEPVLICDTVQTQYGCQYRLVDHESGFALQRRGVVSRWSVVYTFAMRPRQWSDWKQVEDRFREILSGAGRHDDQQILCSRAFANGQAILKGRRYLTVRDGREEVRTVLDDGEHQVLASRILSGSPS